jgi:hypothetical protein
MTLLVVMLSLLLSRYKVNPYLLKLSKESKMSSKSKTASFPILGILGLIFVTLKLAEIGVVATWSWWWVLSPFWIPLAIGLGIFAVVVVVLVVAAMFKK